MKKLMQILNYEFKNSSLLETALTHRSLGHKHNERLEFLGDAVLGLIIARKLYEQYPKVDEGELSRLRANLVNKTVLAEMAVEFNLGEYLKLGAGELKSGGSRRKSILADALEAVIGAVYLDSDIIHCEEVVLHWFKTRLEDPEARQNLKDPKSLLQEYLQAKKLALPQYELISASGEAHEQKFHISCEVVGFKHRTEGIGTSRRAAEQMAAEEYYKWLLKEKLKRAI